MLFDLIKKSIQENQRVCTISKKGGMYKGTLTQKKQREGTGKFSYLNGDVYEGEWKYDKRHGTGKIKFSNGDIYEGEWKNDKKDGVGEIIYTVSKNVKRGVIECDCDEYDCDECINKKKHNKKNCKGEWKNDIMNGKGKIEYDDGTLYEGEFINDEYHGFGKLKYENGNVYEGEFSKCLKHGKGEMIYDCKSIYEGEWENDKKHGKGEMIYDTGNIYKGEWENDKKHGNGSFTRTNGIIYEGYWKKDLEHGYGKFICGEYIYEGEWIKGKKSGFGILTIHDEKDLQYWERGILQDTVELEFDIGLDELDDFVHISIKNDDKFTNDELCEMRCPLSLDYMVFPVSLPCGHVFSKQTIKRVMKIDRRCPLCRRNFHDYEYNEKITKMLETCKFDIKNNEITYRGIEKYILFCMK